MNTRLTMNTRLLPAIAAVVVGAFVAACGAPPTTSQEPEEGAASGASDDGGATGEDPFAPVLEALEGLEGEERTAELVELAKEEGALNIYTSNTDLADFAEVWAEQYGVEEPSVYRAQSHVVAQRLIQEDAAGFAGADFVDTNAGELIILQQEGLLRDYDDLGPAQDELSDIALQEGWTGTRINTYVSAWNSELVTDPPETYEDLTDPRFEGQLMIEERAFEWYMALTDYWVAEGRSREEIDQLFTDIISNATRVRGNTIQAQFLLAGEYAATANVYNHLIDEQTDVGAPITWTPPVEPVVLRPNGMALLQTAQNPATALLFFEWVLSEEGQSLLLEEFRIPVLEALQPDSLDGVATAPVDVEKLAAEGQEWEARYEELLNNAIGSAEG